jgi:hypothetical protein
MTKNNIKEKGGEKELSLKDFDKDFDFTNCKECVHYERGSNPDYLGCCNGCIHNELFADYFTKNNKKVKRKNGT